MSIRSTVKAIIIKDNKMLVNRCHDKQTGDYFTLPGGGQHQYETLHEAVTRECLEETGYTVTPVRFAALYEAITTNEDARKNDAEHSHKIYHVFVCEVLDKKKVEPSEKDSMQVDSMWVDIDKINTNIVSDVRLFPTAIGDNIIKILEGVSPVFLGTSYLA
ncbi:MAG: NUDIX domain-containing protein [Defluviitaleaceae bacterium]|nr:NUDIX domain-containing protein [Defluviitaleaceae bacterium]